MRDDTWKLKFRILRNALNDHVWSDQVIALERNESNKEAMQYYNDGIVDAIYELDEMLGQSEEERLK